jgi:hypothetical protein
MEKQKKGRFACMKIVGAALKAEKIAGVSAAVQSAKVQGAPKMAAFSSKLVGLKSKAAALRKDAQEGLALAPGAGSELAQKLKAARANIPASATTTSATGGKRKKRRSKSKRRRKKSKSRKSKRGKRRSKKRRRKSKRRRSRSRSRSRRRR